MTSSISNGKAYMELMFNITKNNPSQYSRGVIEVCILYSMVTRHILARKSFLIMLVTRRETSKLSVVMTMLLKYIECDFCNG